MNPIRRSAWMVVLLGALAGCSDEDTTAPANSPATPSPSMAPKAPVVPSASATRGEPAKGGMSAEMQPAPAKAGEAGKPDEAKKGEEPPKVEGPKTEAPAKGDTAAVKLTPEEIANIRQLPAADQELALKQAVCPVSDEHLGEMGKPHKVTVEGRTVFLCCDNCEKDLKADPKKFLAKLDAQSSKK